MRGDNIDQVGVFSYISPEARVPHDHPLRAIRQMVDGALMELSPEFDRLYARTGRPSVPPEKLLRALLLQVLYTVRNERQPDGAVGLQPAVPLVRGAEHG